MDIEQHLYLRSVDKSTTPLYRAMVGALVIHALIGLSWYLDRNMHSAEIPDFINVKLTAGFEIVEDKKAEKK